MPAVARDLDVAASEAHRDAGLVRGIGAPALAASVVNAVIGSAIFTLPAVVAGLALGLAPVAYIGCAVIMAGVTLCFAEAGSRVPTSGGAYGTIDAAFGPAAGFVAGALLILSDVLASGGIVAAIADLAGHVAAPLAASPARGLFILAVYAGLAAANVVGVRATARLIAGGTVLKLVPLVLFLAVAAWASLFMAHGGQQGEAPRVVARMPHAAGFGRALILTLFAFEGMETAVGASGEVRDPARTLPRALLGAMGFVLVLYVGAQMGAQSLLGDRLAVSAAPLADAAGRVSALARTVLLGGAGLSMLVWAASDVLGTSRMIFALARDRRLPGFLAAVSPATRVPVRAVLVYCAAACLLAVTGSFVELVLLASLVTVVIYVLVCLAALRLRRSGIALAGPPMHLPGLRIAAAVGLAGMALMLVSARLAELLGLGAAVGLSLLLYLVTENFRLKSAT
jgi:amino acid transporter